MKLGKEIVSFYHGAPSAKEAEENFVRVFQKKELPEEIEEKTVLKGEWKLVDLLVELKIAPSKGEARRLIEQGGVKIEGVKIVKIDAALVIDKKSKLIQAGKRRFVKVKSG